MISPRQEKTLSSPLTVTVCDRSAERPRAKKFRRTSAATLIALATLVVLPVSAWAQYGTTPTDGVRLPNNSINIRNDALALELNPSGLSTIEGFDGQLVFATANDDISAGTGLYLGYGGLGPIGTGFAFQWVDNPALGGSYTKYTLGLAANPADWFSLGLSFNFFNSSTDLAVDKFSSWNAGLQIRPLNWWSLAFAVNDFNRPRLGTHPIDPRYTLGTAIRFVEGRYSFEFDAIHEAGPSQWLLRARASAEPLAGLALFIEAQSGPVTDFSVDIIQGGLTFSFGMAAITASIISQLDDENGITGSSSALRVVSRPLRTILEPRGFMTGLTVTGALPERGRESFILGDQRSFLDLLLYLDEIAHDDRVAGLVLKIEHVSLGLGQHWELHHALTRFKEQGKDLVVHLSTADFGDYYLASAADLVYISPGTALFPAGLSSTLSYIGDLFDNVGVVPEIIRIGEYKSAAEALTESEPSEQTLEAMNAYLDVIFDTMVEAIAEGREQTPDEIREVVDSSPFSATDAEERGLVDGVCFADELETVLSEHYDRRTAIVNGYDPDRWRDYRWSDPPTIAVVHVDGNIVNGTSGGMPIIGETAGHRTLVRVLNELSQSRSVRAIVLRIDSGGGSAWASEAIWRAVQQADERVPVVVSMGDVAASGGYYIAVGGREIFATPLTLTGSIGVFSGHFVARELFEWAGINRFPLLRGNNATLLGMDDLWTESQREAISRDVQIIYDTFLERVADNRGREPSDIDPIARGRIWSGQDALELGLVDENGSLIDAIERAKVLAGLPADAEVGVVQLPERGLRGMLALLGARGEAEIGEDDIEAIASIAVTFGIDRILRYILLYGDGQPATRIEFELDGLE